MLNVRRQFPICFLTCVAAGLTAAIAAAGERNDLRVVPANAEVNWHQWRGPFGTGAAAESARPPVKWNSSDGIHWKADLPGVGSATPVIWGDRVFVVSAESIDRKAETPPAADPTSKTTPPDNYYRFHVTCFDRRTGSVEWTHVATEQVPHEGHHPTHTYAAGSPVTDGERLYVSFSSRGLYCYSLDGRPLWQCDLGDMKTRFGWGESVTPAIAGDLLIVNWDQEENSFVCGLDAKTGEERWRTPRPEEKTSWNTPLITELDGRMLAVINGSGKVRAYDTSNGAVLWECGGQTTNAIPSPVRFEDFVVSMSGYRGAAAFAIPLNSTGDVTGAESLRWQYSRGTPYVPSPTLSGHRLYFTGGNSDVLTCLDVRTGTVIVEKLRLSGVGDIYASPLAAGGHVYVLGREGTAAVIRDEDSAEIVAVNSLDGTFDASPVAVGDQLFLRSWNTLYCLGAESR